MALILHVLIINEMKSYLRTTNLNNASFGDPFKNPWINGIYPIKKPPGWMAFLFKSYLVKRIYFFGLLFLLSFLNLRKTDP